MPILRQLMDTVHDLPAAIGSKLGISGGAAAAPAAVAAEAAMPQKLDGEYEFREYFAAACPHCKHLTPVWDAASRSHAAQTGGNVKWSQIECADESWNPVAENEESCKHIMGFPTMKMFKDGKEIGEYEGARNEAALIDYVNQQAGIKAACMPIDLAIVMGMKPDTEHADNRQKTKNFL